MPEFLLFQLHGALASWGDIAVGEYRPSLGHPSKSAIMGLLAAALGIKRNDDARHLQLTSSYCFAVRVQMTGELLRDYHTVQVPAGKREYATRRDELLTDKLNLKTILSQRDYRTDAMYQVAIWGGTDALPYSLANLKHCLERPVFTLYLGRKSCPPSLPLQPLIISAVTLKKALDQYSQQQIDSKIEQALNPLTKSDQLISYYWESGKLNSTELGMTASMTYPRRDQVSSRKRWQFNNRDEFYFAKQEDVIEEGV